MLVHKRLTTTKTKQAVLTKALLNLAKHYQLTHKDLADIMGFSEATMSRLFKGARLIDPNAKEGEFALLLLRLYRGLNALLGSNYNKAILWLHSYNSYFSKTPLEHIKSISGLVDTVNYIDAMRGKV